MRGHNNFMNSYIKSGIILIFVFFLFVQPVYAQFESLREPQVTIASSASIVSSGEVLDGSLVVSNENGFEISTKEYQPSIYGVVVFDPAVILNQTDDPESFPIVSSGTVRVRVSGVNGAIKKGDFLTSSKIEGVAMKATRSGFAVGTALEDYESLSSDEEGLILISLRTQNYIAPSNVNQNLRDIFDLSTVAAYQQPIAVFRYVMAGLIVVLSVFLGIFYFGRIAISGVEALGRNPLAGKKIQVGIILSVVLALGVITAGVAVAVFILRL